MNVTRRAVLAMPLGLLAPALHAQSLPQQARLLVGFPPGAGADLVARQLSVHLAGKLAPSVIVDNKPGGMALIAAQAAVAAVPDGSTLLLNPSAAFTVTPHAVRKMAFSPFDDLTPVSQVCRYELGFAVGPAVPASVTSLSQFVAWAREQKTPLAYGSPGAGSSIHFMAHAFNSSQQLNMLHVPYKGASQVVTDMLGGQIAAGAGSLPALMAQAKGGRIRVLASTGRGRSRYFPEIPTFEEQGFEGLDMREWHGIYVGGKPAGQVLERLVSVVHEVVRTPAFVEALGRMGFEAVSSTPRELDALGRADSARWENIVKSSGFVADV